MVIEEKPLYETENVDLEIFKKFVTPFYNPSDSPFVMCVGALCVNEGRMLRKYHKEVFGINGNMRIAACNITSGLEGISLSGNYDLEISCSYRGDAQTSLPYMVAQEELNVERAFDLVYIRNPDLVNSRTGENYDRVFTKAIEQITKGGVVVTLVQEGDLPQYEILLNSLQKRNIFPVISRETRLNLENPIFNDNFFHTVGIFKNKSY